MTKNAVFGISTLEFVSLQNIVKQSKWKSALFAYFWARILKKYCHIWNQHLQIIIIVKFSKKQKCLNLRPKMPHLGIFDQKCLIWVFLGKIFRKTIVIFEISTLKFVYLQYFTKKQKCLNLDQNAWFGYFWAGIWKQYCHIWNQHPRICLVAKFRGKTKMPKFGMKNG